LGIVHVLVQSFATKLEARRAGVVPATHTDGHSDTVARRAEAALRNFFETFPLFAAVVLVAHVAGRANEATAIGAQLYFWGRVGYLGASLAGLIWVRFAVWAVSLAGIVVIVSRTLS
ncbi:MAG: MAPEG family protein, partial [Hyphomicrobiales bacterium]